MVWANPSLCSKCLCCPIHRSCLPELPPGSIDNNHYGKPSMASGPFDVKPRLRMTAECPQTWPYSICPPSRSLSSLDLSYNRCQLDLLIISHCIQISRHYIVRPKLICSMSIISPLKTIAHALCARHYLDIWGKLANKTDKNPFPYGVSRQRKTSAGRLFCK